MAKSVAIIPARGGSKRIPRKNIKDFYGKPLIAYSIETAIKSDIFNKIVVTTDDNEIASIAKKYGAEVIIRPKKISDDYTGTKEVIDHSIAYLQNRGEEFDFVCTIYATAPLLQSKYLIKGLKELKNSSAINAFSATSMPFPIQRTFKIDSHRRCEMFTPQYYNTRSQDLEEAYQDAGQFYWSKIGQESDEIFFGQDSIPIIIPRYLVQDIDTLEDWTRAEIMYEVISRREDEK
jgi:N-acylneuraminate cytidylyltransferase